MKYTLVNLSITHILVESEIVAVCVDSNETVTWQA